jgi:hypothetical protein
MGKLKEQMLRNNETDNYLTMSRIENRKWNQYEKEEVWGKGHTGLAEIAIKKAFHTGFMEGFCFRFTGEE